MKKNSKRLVRDKKIVVIKCWTFILFFLSVNMTGTGFAFAEDDYPCYPCVGSIGSTTTTAYIKPDLDKRILSPAIVPPGDTMVAPNGNQCRATVMLDTPTVVAPAFCSIPIRSITNDAPAYFQLGTTQVHWTFTNIYNRSTVVNQNVIVTSTLHVTTLSNNPSCFGSQNGIIQAIPSGGTPQYQFLWSNNATTQAAFGLQNGTYTVTVTDANGCTTSASVTLFTPQLNVSAQVLSNVSTCGGSDGSASANSSGGTPPVQLSWSDNLNQAGSTATNLQAGSYTVTAVDANGCTATSTVEIADLNCTATLNLKVFIEGYYIGSGHMQPLLYNVQESNDITLSDSITVELHDTISPYGLAYSKTGLLHTDGTASFSFSPLIRNHSYYIVIRHRSSIETWSKFPVLFDVPIKNFDFTAP